MGHGEGRLGCSVNLLAKTKRTGMDEDVPLELPIDGVLDLHTFPPGEVKDLIPDYLVACQERDILQVRIIHGKGTGTLRRTVHAILARLPAVGAFDLAMEDARGWGGPMVM